MSKNTKPLLAGFDGRAANTSASLGVGVYCRNLLRELARLDSGLALRVYLDVEPRPDFPLRVDEADIRVLPAARFWTQRRLGPELRRDPPDVLLCPVSQAPLFSPCPTIVTNHGLVYYEENGRRVMEPRDCLPLVTRAQRALLWRLQVRCASRILMVSEDSRRVFIEHTGIDPAKVFVTYLGHTPEFRPMTDNMQQQQVRNRYELPARFFLYTGRLGPRKNVVRIIQAFELLRDSNPDLPHELVLAGDKEWHAEPILHAARASRHADAIHMIGHVGHEDMPTLMTLADALILVSLCESFGIPVVEAMACGTPVLTSNTTCMPEIVGEAAMAVPPTDVPAIAAAMHRLASDQELRERLVKDGFARAARFTWRNTALQTYDAVRSVTAENSRGAAP
ncbi:MAG TPA: glycosyltransferase family 1 protein [Candidatus Hydrogenedentes bacterium]|nr:glycosyltransferase family 1 protein [Candidatus Hydrogenedentota bacterium]HNT86920.1 glycosyltransferase family 1 protein [Candidatus Hydrogenedentota bacterium]